jgi:hypothetical protein
MSGNDRDIPCPCIIARNLRREEYLGLGLRIVVAGVSLYYISFPTTAPESQRHMQFCHGSSLQWSRGVD